MKQYENVVRPRLSAGERVVRINIKVLDEYLTRKWPRAWQARPTTDDRVDDCNLTYRVEKYLCHRSNVERQASIEMPQLGGTETAIYIAQGRHRLYAMIDSGYTHVDVVAAAKISDEDLREAGLL
jgi:hypothetical protein